MHLGSLARFANYPRERIHTLHTASYIYELAFFATTNSRARREITFDYKSNDTKLITNSMDNELRKTLQVLCVQPIRICKRSAMSADLSPPLSNDTLKLPV